MTTRHIVIPYHAVGQRFDLVISGLFPEFSRSRLAQWIKDGRVLLDGQIVRPRTLVHGGEQVALDAVSEVRTRDSAEAIPLDILYQDTAVFVINKPVGLVVHPGAGNRSGTLVNALLNYDPSLAELPRAGIVHRLDKDTSGVMAIARTPVAYNALIAQLEKRKVRRQYLAIVVGALISGGTANFAIGRHPRERVRMAIRADGREAITHYRLHTRFRTHTALRCRLETGRTHQIRVHMAHLGHPIVGDQTYGGRLRFPRAASEALITTLRTFKRQALHAELLEFTHPLRSEPLCVRVDPPQDMMQLLAVLREDSSSDLQ